MVTPSHGTVPRGVPGPGGAETDGAAPVAAGRQEVGVHLVRVGESVIWVRENGYVHPAEA